MLLLRERPELKILIIEKAAAFSRRVGEATVEVSGYFLGRGLGWMLPVWRRCWRASKAGGAQTKRIRPRRFGRAGRASRIGTGLSWQKNIRTGQWPAMGFERPPPTIWSATAGGPGAFRSKAAMSAPGWSSISGW